MAQQDKYSEEVIEYLKINSPEKWHQIAWNWNWDNGIEPLKWIVNQPNCNRGTALLIYWRAAPRYYSQYKNEGGVDKYELANYKFVKEIEGKYTSGFYKDDDVFFDPMDDEGLDWTKEYSEIEMKVPIPQEMYRSTTGKKLKKEQIADGFPDEVIKKTQRWQS